LEIRKSENTVKSGEKTGMGIQKRIEISEDAEYFVVVCVFLFNEKP